VVTIGPSRHHTELAGRSLLADRLSFDRHVNINELGARHPTTVLRRGLGHEIGAGGFPFTARGPARCQKYPAFVAHPIYVNLWGRMFLLASSFPFRFIRLKLNTSSHLHVVIDAFSS